MQESTDIARQVGELADMADLGLVCIGVVALWMLVGAGITGAVDYLMRRDKP